MSQETSLGLRGLPVNEENLVGGVFIYPKEFEALYRDILKKNDTGSKELCYAMFLKLYDPGINEQVKAKDKWIKQLLENQCYCEICGCTELLCGHNKRG